MQRIQFPKRVGQLAHKQSILAYLTLGQPLSKLPVGFNRMNSGGTNVNHQEGQKKDEKLHPIFSKDKSAPLPSFKTDPYPIALQNPAHPTTNQTHNVNQQIYHQIDQLKQFEDKHNESYDDTKSDSTSDKLRSRLVYQSRKRGIVEIELLLSTFVESQRWLKDWDMKQLSQYSRLLMLPDWDLYYYLVKKQDPPSDSEFFKSDLLDQLRIHTSNSSKTVRIMPSLHS
ncbi:hypothetical protein Pst134EA_024439 [Puccinia striiformis f. sp. tritici]|nr:hypothetical protein Pst134EA_024439 [Puccinia striiformis f. sp. tritici]KAH9453570.1 hypothetical protein Pst134EA_024439 [Puccinia striiformis f. sp. tritici]KNE98771.1 hypothetical protein PSTG_07958 [Puccinia striiformis f. sp. tritici PST-78]POV96449.1 hypothetical protein PSHT_15131 [Puccinia striiformis]